MPSPPPQPGPSRRRRRRALIAAALAVACLLLGALAGEAWVRWRHPAYADQWTALTAHPRWARTLRPSVAGRLRQLGGGYDTRFRTNAQGLREARDVGPKRPGVPRVVCVGDSNTFGLGVDDGEVWVRRLEEAGVEPLDAGWAAGYAPDCACVWLEEVGLSLQPDVVIQQLTSANDLEDVAARSEWTTDPATGRLLAVRHAWDRRAPSWLQALALPRWLALQVLPRLRGATQAAEAPPAAVDPEGLRRLRLALEQERALLEARGVRLLVLLMPCFSAELPHVAPPERARLLALREAFLGLARELRLELLDPAGSPEWEGAPRPRFHTDGHLTASGNEAVGRWVARELAARLTSARR